MAVRAGSITRQACRIPWLAPFTNEAGGILENVSGTLWNHQQFRLKQRLSMVLTTHVESLGRPGRVIQVAPGYARNKLMPQRLALPAIDKFLKQISEERKKAPAQLVSKDRKLDKKVRLISEDDVIKEAEAAAKRLDAGRLAIRCSTPHKSNTVQSPVTVPVILGEVRRQMGIELAEANVNLPEELTTIGDYEVTLRFPRGVHLPGEKENIKLKVRLRRK